MTDRRAELRATLVEANDALQTALASLTAAEWLSPSPNDGWSAKDTLAHLTSIEARQRVQILAILGQGSFPVDDVNVFNERMVAERRSWTVEQLLDELSTGRAETLAILDRIGDEDVDRYFDHPRRGRLSIAYVYEHMAEHTTTHAEDITAVKST
jgi:uncharacterized protein (TIGR03083 family)